VELVDVVEEGVEAGPAEDADLRRRPGHEAAVLDPLAGDDDGGDDDDEEEESPFLSAFFSDLSDPLDLSDPPDPPPDLEDDERLSVL
jgi:hypothetical protein